MRRKAVRDHQRGVTKYALAGKKHAAGVCPQGYWRCFLSARESERIVFDALP